MFYSYDNLKKGGRFHMCWVADSWPAAFESITSRQLFRQDILKLCDELLDVITSESGRPTNRFSLRLSSQLLHGIARIYQKQVSIVLHICLRIEKIVNKSVKKKFKVQIEADPPRPEEVMLQPSLEEIIVQRIQEYFGESNPDVAMQLYDRTMEHMMHLDVSAAAQHSVLEQWPESFDKTQLAHTTPRFSAIHDSLLRGSNAADLQPSDATLIPADLPPNPDILLPELPVPQPENAEGQLPMETEQRQAPAQVVKTSQEIEPHFELKELEEPVKRKRKNRGRLIYDRKIEIDIRPQIDNDGCQQTVKEVVPRLRVPVNEYFQYRTCRGGNKVLHFMGLALLQLFIRNLGSAKRSARDQRERQVTIMPAIIEKPAELPLQMTPETPQMMPEAPQTIPPLPLPVVIVSSPTKNLDDNVTNRTKTRRAIEDISNWPTSQNQIQTEAEVHAEPKRRRIDTEQSAEANEENIPDNGETNKENTLMREGMSNVIDELQQAVVSTTQVSPKPSDEIQLGSLNRTKVSVCDNKNKSVVINDDWGTEGTLLKIRQLIILGYPSVTLDLLTSKFPVLPGHRRLTLARCFISVLKLKEFGFATVTKKPNSTEIDKIFLGRPLIRK